MRVGVAPNASQATGLLHVLECLYTAGEGADKKADDDEEEGATCAMGVDAASPPPPPRRIFPPSRTLSRGMSSASTAIIRCRRAEATSDSSHIEASTRAPSHRAA